MKKQKTKSKQTTNQQTSLVNTPTNPSWLEPQVQGLAGKIDSTFQNLDPYSLVAGPDPLQTQAAQGAAGLTASPVFDRVANAGPQTVQAASSLDNLSAYLNPYLENVVKSSLLGFDQNADQTRQQQTLDLAGDSTFGGSGGSILRSLTEGQFAQQRGALDSGLRFGAQDRAFGLSSEDANRRQSASASNAGLAEQALARQLAAAQAGGAENRANIDVQSQMGEMLRQIEAAKRLAPVNALGAQGSLISGLPLDLFHGSNSTGSLSGTSTGKTTSTSGGVGFGWDPKNGFSFSAGG